MKMKKNKLQKSPLSEEDIAGNAAIEEWEQDIKVKFTYEDKLRDEGAKLERERIKNLIDGGSLDLQHFKEKSLKPKKFKKHVKFQIVGIDIQKLVKELEEGDYFDKEYRDDIVAWFNGSVPARPILMNVGATLFVSLIAEMMDFTPKVIYNSKEYIYGYIQESFQFNGRTSERSFIKQIMKPNSSNRVSSAGKTIPDYRNFLMKHTT